MLRETVGCSGSRLIADTRDQGIQRLPPLHCRRPGQEYERQQLVDSSS